MNRSLYATVSEQDEGLRIKDFLRRRWGISTALLIELKRRDDGICINGARVTVNYVLQEGDRLVLNVGDDGADSGFEDLDLPLNVLYEDSDVIVLNKPPFLAVHPSKGHVNDTLANGLSHYFHQKGETFVSRCVLRLDRNTSGAVLFA
ncbi:MAG: RluA family pseudouridine synthase, partial [Clostridia bacterium]|nr:RluA family pseudouridine synthase [Clostridia bacterium]